MIEGGILLQMIIDTLISLYSVAAIEIRYIYELSAGLVKYLLKGKLNVRWWASVYWVRQQYGNGMVYKLIVVVIYFSWHSECMSKSNLMNKNSL